MTWFRSVSRLIGRGAQEETAANNPLPVDEGGRLREDLCVASDSGAEKEECIGLFMFSRQEVSDRVSVWYGQYTDGIVLRALAGALRPHGGWQPSSLAGCHGDLFAETLGTLRQWLRRGSYKIDVSNLDGHVLQQLQSVTDPAFVPCLIGIGMIEKARLLSAHRQLECIGAAGYLGLITLRRELVVDVARELGLLFEGMTIRDGVCGGGWQAGADDLQLAGLREERR